MWSDDSEQSLYMHNNIIINNNNNNKETKLSTNNFVKWESN